MKNKTHSKETKDLILILIFQDCRNLITVCFLRPYDSGIKQAKPSKYVVNISN